MPKFWIEPVDPERHVDHFHAGSAHPRTRGAGQLAYFVRVAGFTFEFATLDQIRECLAWFSFKIHPSSRVRVFEPEKGEWQLWHSRLPARVKKGSKRERVVKGLQAALVAFDGRPGRRARLEPRAPQRCSER